MISSPMMKKGKVKFQRKNLEKPTFILKTFIQTQIQKMQKVTILIVILIQQSCLDWQFTRDSSTNSRKIFLNILKTRLIMSILFKTVGNASNQSAFVPANASDLFTTSAVGAITLLAPTCLMNHQTMNFQTRMMMGCSMWQSRWSARLAKLTGRSCMV